MNKNSFLKNESECFSFSKGGFKGYYGGEWVKLDWIWARALGIIGDSLPDLEGDIKNISLELEEELDVNGLWIEEGFINGILKIGYKERLEFPSVDELEAYKGQSNAFLVTLEESPETLKFCKKIPDHALKAELKAFRDQNLFIILSKRKEKSIEFSKLVEETVKIISKYKFCKGWPGYFSGYYTITPKVEHPLDLISKALKDRCSWILLCGYNDILALNKVKPFLDELSWPFVISAGQPSSDKKAVMYKMKYYPNPQDCPLPRCIKFTKENKGLLFIRYCDVDFEVKDEDFHGYLLSSQEGELAEKLNKPFITSFEGNMGSYPPSMILLIGRDEELNEETLFKAILDKRAIVIFPRGKIFGSSLLSKSLKLLVLEREYLRESFGEDVELEAEFENDHLKVTLLNRSAETLTGELKIQVSSSIKLEVEESTISLKPEEKVERRFPVSFTKMAAARENLALASFTWMRGRVYALTHKAIPEPISTYSILYEEVGDVKVSFTVYNYTRNSSVDVKIEVWSEGNILESRDIKVNVPSWTSKRVETKVSVYKPSEYLIKFYALGYEKQVKLVASEHEGWVKVRRVDYDKDGLNEIVMENEYVKVTILPIGGRVIEYLLKERNENIFFVIWPKKPDNWKVPGRKAQYWPYGGLEEFLNYPTFDGHVPFKCEVEEEGPTRARVKAKVNVKGNLVEKIFTLYGDSPLLEVRYKLNVNPEINILGVNPLIELGRRSDMQDVYYFPTVRGVEERRALHTRNYGECFFHSEGWTAGYDTEEDISIIMGFDANQPFLVHLWQNTPSNVASQHCYVEVQPWVKLSPHVDNYFTYYILGYNGHWKDALENFKKLGLLTRRTKPHLLQE